MIAVPDNCARHILIRCATFALAIVGLLSAESARAQAVPTMTAKIMWQSVDRDEAPLSSLAQIAVDAKQRSFVADHKENAIFVFDANGAYLKKFSRSGSGPGEFRDTCCMAFDAKGRLWVQDLAGARFVVFAMTDSGKSVSVKPAFVVHLPHTDTNYGTPLSFDAKGNVTSVGHVSDPDDPKRRLAKRFIVDSTGKVLRSTLEVLQTENITPPFLYEVKSQGSTFYLYQPYGADPLRADGFNGTYAIAGSGKYSVRWYAPTGALLSTISRDVSGPTLSSQERVHGDSLLVAMAKRSQTTVSGLPFGLPNRKPPLSAMFIDHDGRLWVQRTTAIGAPREADVYAPTGAQVFRAVWPENVRLASSGYIHGNSAWGVILDSDDVPHVVRLDFTAAK